MVDNHRVNLTRQTDAGQVTRNVIFIMAMKKSLRLEVYNKFNGRCAYCGLPLEDDWQVDHLTPKRNGGTDDISNLLPCLKMLNHYKRALPLEMFRVDWLGGLHKRLPKLPKNPRTENGRRRKEYMLKIAKCFNITPEKPFGGQFYFEKYNKALNPDAKKHGTG